jgi:serine/threonine protein kinase
MTLQFQLSPTQRRQLELIDAFETSWQNGTTELQEFLASLDEPPDEQTLAELQQVDQERRLRDASTHPKANDSTRDVNSVDAKPPSPVAMRRDSTKSLPSHIGGYEIREQIGSGGFGSVYRAFDPKIGRFVAIKWMHQRSPGFLHEARAVANLRHPNLVQVLQVGEVTQQDIAGGHDGPTGQYLVYEMIEGEPLSCRIAEQNYTITDVRRWMKQIADGLQVVHAKKIVHRDIAPKNIMIDHDDQAILIDFGLACIDGKFFQQDANIILGTPHFMSPEQAQGDSNWSTSQSDIFSLGSVMYQLLTGKLPFPGDDKRSVLRRVLEATPAPPRSLRPEIEVDLENVCLKALEKRPQDRFRTAHDFSRALLPQPARNDRRTMFIGALVVGLGIVLGGAMLRRDANTPVPEKGVNTPEIVTPEVQSLRFTIDQGMRGYQPPHPSDFPLQPHRDLIAAWDLNVPAYSYLVQYDHDATATVLFPDGQARIESSGRVALQTPDVAGLCLVLYGITQQPLTSAKLQRLTTSQPLGTQIDQQQASSYGGRFLTYKKRPLDCDDAIAVLDGMSPGKVEMSVEFRDLCDEMFVNYVGHFFCVATP